MPVGSAAETTAKCAAMQASACGDGFVLDAANKDKDRAADSCKAADKGTCCKNKAVQCVGSFGACRANCTRVFVAKSGAATG